MREIIKLLIWCFCCWATLFNLVESTRKGGDILILKGGNGGYGGGGCGHVFLKTGHRKKGDILIIGGDCRHHDETHYIPIPYSIGYGGYGGYGHGMGHADHEDHGGGYRR